MKTKILLLTIFLFVTTSCKFVNVHLASDANSGEYIGVVQNEIRDYESKEIIYYEIGTDKGLVRKSPQEINIYEP